MKHIKAIFRGQNGSLGYETNKEYVLGVEHSKNQNITIRRNFDNEGFAEYESMIAFLKNWDNIRTI